MAIISKTNTKGIDTVISSLQNDLFLKFSANWLAGATYDMYPRANKLLIGEELLPVVSTDEKDYILTLFDDKFSATSFFLPEDQKNYSYGGGGITQRLDLIFQVDLKELYNSGERLDEVFNTEVLALIDRHYEYIVSASDVVVVEGVDLVYSDFRLSSQTKTNIMASDTSHYHVVKFSFDVFYDVGCVENEVSSCFPVIINVNGVLMTSAATGSTANITIKDTLGVDQGVRQGDTFNYVVPAGFEVVRLYATPIYSGAIDREVDYDTYWRKANNEGNLSQPAIGIQMRCAFGRQDILDPAITQGNIFGGMSRFTGTGGGYLNWLTGVYYDKDDVVTTRVLAYPNSLAIDHVQGLLVQIDQLGSQPWVNWLNNGQTLTIGAYTGFYLASVVEMVSFGNWGVTRGYFDDSPLFKWGSGLKLTSDTYAGSTTQAMVAQFYSHITSGSKGNSNKSIYIKYIDINSDFG